MVWPLIARGLGQSLRLTHLAIGSACALVIFGGAWVLNGLWMSLNRSDAGPVRGAPDGSPFSPLGVFWPTGGPMPLDRRVDQLRFALADQGWMAVVVLAASILIASLFLGAIARSTALDLAKGRSAGVAASCRFALQRAPTLLFAVTVPMLLIALLLFGIRAFGFALFSTDIARPVGGVLYIVPLLLGLGVALLGLFFAAGHCMLAPASMVEDSDGLDAIQRAASYLVGRPIRFVFYIAVAGVLVYVAYFVLQTVVRLAIDVASGALPRPTERQEPSFTTDAIAFWIQMLWLIFIGWVISFYGAASTIIYLLMRSSCDGEDVSVVAMPSGGH
jgi:hypothetical protein